MSENTNSVPEEFIKVVRDFIGDLKTTFPEYVPFIDKWWKSKEHFNYIEEEDDRNNAYEKSEKKAAKVLFEFCKKKLPPRFFDILYQNEEMFKEESEIDTEFFPKIHFKNLWQCDISEKTRETIWKYLQLLLFSIVGTLDNKEAFGDTAKLFEAINEDEFKSKLQETLSQMQGLFDIPEGGGVGPENLGEGLNASDLPNAEQINEHITGMLDGKIGQLAREIAEETAANLNMDFDGATDMKDVFSKLMKNPTKLMGLIKNVGDKLDTKLKSGELKESEMIQEATEIMNKMKNMPGMGYTTTLTVLRPPRLHISKDYRTWIVPRRLFMSRGRTCCSSLSPKDPLLAQIHNYSLVDATSIFGMSIPMGEVPSEPLHYPSHFSSVLA
jgi:hypothetical protein